MLDLVLEKFGLNKIQSAAFKELLEVTNCNKSLQETFESPLAALKCLLESTQTTWLRKAGTERWDQKDSKEMIANRQRILTLLSQLELLAEKKPMHKSYRYVLLLGALQARVERRLDYLGFLLQGGMHFSQLVLLGGQRPLIQDKEPIANSLKDEATELNMMESLVQKRLKDWHLSEIEIIPINAPLNAGRRPTTSDTVKLWLDSNPKPGSVLAISDQPHMSYQHAVLSNALAPHFTLETIGCAASPEVEISVVLDALARRIYAQYPSVEAKLTQDLESQAVDEAKNSFSFSR